MKIIDTIFSLICGWLVGWLAYGFLKDYGLDIGIWRWFLPTTLAVISLFCLWLADFAGRKFLFVFQAAKFVLTGVLATIIDLVFFEAFVWIFSAISFTANLLIPKTISFLIATFTKFWGNKFWAFNLPAQAGKHEKENMKKEFVQFFAVTLVALLIDISFFFYLTKISGPQFAIPYDLWLKLSVLASAITSAVWSFCGYKFIVFKK